MQAWPIQTPRVARSSKKGKKYKVLIKIFESEPFLEFNFPEL
jgi:hypothetical protein